MSLSNRLHFAKIVLVMLMAGSANAAYGQSTESAPLDYRHLNERLGGLRLPTDDEIKAHGNGMQMPTDEEIAAQQASRRQELNRSFDQLDERSIGKSALKPYKAAATEEERGQYASTLTNTQGILADRVAKSVQDKSAMGGLTSPAQTDRLQQLLQQQEQAKKALSNQMRSGTHAVPEDALLIFVSFSMPEQVLKNLAEQARTAGGVMVLRGMVDGKLSATQDAARAVNQAGASWEINPELFTTFDVQTVPAFVLTGNKEVIDQGCALDADGQCSSKNTFSKVSGDISVIVALDTMRMRTNIPFVKEIAEKRLKAFTKKEG